MIRLNALNPEQATGKTKQLFEGIERQLGMVPNMMKTMGNSPAFLEGYLTLNAALASGKLGSRLGELIALAVAESNHCDYCLSAHTYIGTNLAKMDSLDLETARNGMARDTRTEAILQFAKTLVIKRGLVTDADVNDIKSAGITDGEVGEIVGHVALNILTNYFNNTANTEIDFPLVSAKNKISA
jgi:uncharacterized peroxidase-related enzyme